MLEKIESAYLAVMRVVVLIAATIALIVCVVGAGFAAPIVLRQLGFASGAPQVTGADLASFVDEQKAAPAAAETTGSAEAPLAAPPDKIAKAADIFAGYLEAHTDRPLDPAQLTNVADQLATVMKSKRDELDLEYRGAYEDSLLKLAEDLKASKGKPLSPTRVSQLVEWHLARFQSEIAAKKEERLAQAVKAQAGMVLASGGLVAFILILFFFLFVKIERNLRLVRTREVTP